MSTTKIERLINLTIMLLETSRPVTPEQIRDTVSGYGDKRDDSFKRMFERDKEALREMGIPLELEPTDDWEQEFGYRIDKERYYLPDLELQPDEVASLWIAAGLVKLSDPWNAKSALMKLGGDPPPEESSARLMADLGLQAKGLTRAFEAVVSRRRISFRYTTKDVQTRREVEPYGLVHRKGVWYVVGRDTSKDESRTFRIDRMTALAESNPKTKGEEYEVPEDFRAEIAVGSPPFVGEEDHSLEANVTFAPAAAWLVERNSPWLDLEFSEDGSASANILVADQEGFVSWLLWFGAEAELTSPPELIDLVRSAVKSLL